LLPWPALSRVRERSEAWSTRLGWTRQGYMSVIWFAGECLGVAIIDVKREITEELARRVSEVGLRRFVLYSKDLVILTNFEFVVKMICHCGRTVLEPPIPCGTRVNCRYQCTRPPPPCGHPRTQHSCHEDPSACPPCPFLTGKPCACGKKIVENVRCSQEKVSCGAVCGR
jgi:hypothetical protein